MKSLLPLPAPRQTKAACRRWSRGRKRLRPNFLALPRRRTFKARDKPGGISAVLRREGLYSSAISDWRRQRDAGAFAALSPVARGPKTAPVNPLAADHARLLLDHKRLTRRLERIEAIIDLQKKVAALLGLPIKNVEEP